MSSIDKTMFREYDIRGLVNDSQLNDESVLLITKGISTYLWRLGFRRIIIGHDSRESSPRFHKIAVESFKNTGFDVVDISLCLVPMFYAGQYFFSCEAGVYISASHNPSNWNGFKIANGYSSTILGKDLQDLYEIIQKGEFVLGEGKIKKEDVFKPYKENILNKIKVDKKIKVVIDSGNATAGAFVPQIFRDAGFDVFELYCDLDPSFPHHDPNPSAPENKADLAKKVLEVKADIGFAFDTDGDRLGVVDEKGCVLEADQYLILLARQVLEKEKGEKIIFDVKSSQALIEDIEKHSGIPVMWKTGHSYIKAKLKEENAPLAGELSGHVFYRENHGFDDAVFAAFKLASYLSTFNQPLSNIMETVPSYVSTPAINVSCSDSDKYDVVMSLTEEFKKEYPVIEINGARVQFPNGWGLVRASSNLPVLVLRFEAKTKQGLEKIMAVFKEKMEKYKSIGKEWSNG